MSTFEFDTAYSAITGEHAPGHCIPTVEHSDDSDMLIDGVGLIDGPGPVGEWRALTGYTRQHGYRGAVMHLSEAMSDDAIREAVLDAGGDVFAIVEVRYADMAGEYAAYPDGIAGWAVIYRVADEDCDDLECPGCRDDMEEHWRACPRWDAPENGGIA